MHEANSLAWGRTSQREENGGIYTNRDGGRALRYENLEQTRARWGFVTPLVCGYTRKRAGHTAQPPEQWRNSVYRKDLGQQLSQAPGFDSLCEVLNDLPAAAALRPGRQGWVFVGAERDRFSRLK